MDGAFPERPAEFRMMTPAALRAMAARTMDAERARKLAILADQMEQGVSPAGGTRRLPVLPPV